MSVLKTIDIEPTTVCNLKCPFCFGPKVESVKGELSLETWKETIIRFKNWGVENVVISGGEPLLYKNIEELIKFIKHNDLSIVLSTHGRFRNKLLKIVEYCDWISLPIDGYKNDTAYTLRTDNVSNQEILKTAKLLKLKNPKIKIKIGTVATKVNIDEIENINSLLDENIGIFDTWKIYQYTPRRKYKENSDHLSIDDSMYEELVSKINALNKNKRIVYSSNESRKNAYLFIYYDGDVTLVNCGNDFGDDVIGNVKTFDNINLKKIVYNLKNNHTSNYKNTY